jgi:hypothetical protein
MARPRGKRFPLPTMEQLHAGMDATEASASSERLLDMWLERDDEPVDRMGPRVLPDGTRGPDRNVFHTISTDGSRAADGRASQDPVVLHAFDRDDDRETRDPPVQHHRGLRAATPSTTASGTSPKGASCWPWTWNG